MPHRAYTHIIIHTRWLLAREAGTEEGGTFPMATYGLHVSGLGEEMLS